MALYKEYYILSIFCLLAGIMSINGHQPPPAPPAEPTPPAGPTPTSSDPGAKDEEKFLVEQKDCWSKAFGDMPLPPCINGSLTYLPPVELIEGLKAMSKHVGKGGIGGIGYQDPKIRGEIKKAIAASGRAKIGGGGAVNIDPEVQAQIVKNLKAVLNSESGWGNNDAELEVNIKKFVQILASGSKLNNNGATVDLTGMNQQAKTDVKSDMAISLGGNVANNGNPKGMSQAFSFGRVPPLSTILPISKCTGSPELDNEVHDQSIESLFFQAENLSLGKKFKLNFAKSKNYAAFISSSLVDKSGLMNSLVLMDMISVLTSSMDTPQTADLMPEMDTIGMCEQPATKGKNKEKACCTDLETMLNYTMAMVGDNIRAATLWIENDKGIEGEFTISKLQKLPAVNIVGCTKMSFSVAIFYCVPLPKAVAYTVSLDSADGTKVKAPVLCHEDTTVWSPNSWLFKSLNTKPGPASKICHFLAADDICWMPKTQENVAV